MLDPAKVRALQTRVGVTADGDFGPNTLDATLAALAGTGLAAAAVATAIAAQPAAETVPAVAATAHLANADAFFGHMRDCHTLGPVLTRGEVDGCNAILNACGAAAWPIADVAYALATAYHETAGTMTPIHELGGPSYLTRMYDVTGSRPDLARREGNTTAGDGVRYAGRGFVQLTWKANYALAAGKLGVDLVGNPDLALQPDVAAKIMIEGMREGWFTRRDLDDDLPRQGPATLEQFVRSRDIINGTDKAAQIAAEAVDFQNALIAGGWR